MLWRSFYVYLKKQMDDWKVRLLLRKLGLTEHNQYSNYILPKYLQDYNFTETVEILKQIFGECISLFNICLDCLNITKSDSVNFIMYAGTIKNEHKQFKISSVTDAQLKCLIFICGLRFVGVAEEVSIRILSKIKQNHSWSKHTGYTQSSHGPRYM